jgi:hypothetical protein
MSFITLLKAHAAHLAKGPETTRQYKNKKKVARYAFGHKMADRPSG